MGKHNIRLIKTLPNKLVGCYRILLGLNFIVVGNLKLFHKSFITIWDVQLKELEVPFLNFMFYFVPTYEIIVGGLLVIGYNSRVYALAVIPIMAVAIHMHLTVYNPEAFIFQPYEVFYPSINIMLALVVVVYGGGRWSLDLKNYKKHPDYFKNYPF